MSRPHAVSLSGLSRARCGRSTACKRHRDDQHPPLAAPAPHTGRCRRSGYRQSRRRPGPRGAAEVDGLSTALLFHVQSVHRAASDAEEKKCMPLRTMCAARALWARIGCLSGVTGVARVPLVRCAMSPHRRRSGNRVPRVGHVSPGAPLEIGGQLEGSAGWLSMSARS